MRVKTLLLCSVFLLIFSSLSAMTPPRPAVKKIPADEFEYTDGLAWDRRYAKWVLGASPVLHRVAATYERRVRHIVGVHALPEELVPTVLGMIVIESDGDPNKVGAHGEAGLMQLMPSVVELAKKETGVKFPNGIHHPYDNMWTGVWYLKRLMTKYGLSPADAVLAYNLGPSGLETRNDDPESASWKFGYYRKIAHLLLLLKAPPLT